MAANELVAAVLGVGAGGADAEGVAKLLMRRIGGVRGLANATVAQLSSTRGIGVAQATRLCAAVELGRRCLQASADIAPILAGPEDVHGLLAPRIGHLEQEVFVVLSLDARNRLRRQVEIARGSLTQVDVHPREVFRLLIREGAAAGIVAHNHPSGDPAPSQDDIELTRRLLAVGELVGIPILDHVVITGSGFRSLAEVLTVPEAL